MIEQNLVKNYDKAVDSYTSFEVNSKIRGTLVSKEEKDLKLDIGDNHILEISLRTDVDIKPGETVVIERSNIARSKVVDATKDIPLADGDAEIYSPMLKSMGLEYTEENAKVLKKMEHFGVDINRENFNTYSIAKSSLEEIALSLSYESALKLEDMGIDLKNDSVQVIADALKDIRIEKEGFNLLKLFKSKELSTEEAESIALKVYGSKMGKDITDIIKILHKNEVSITKKNIEKIDDTFYKLHKLKDIEDKTFIDTLKSDLDLSIDSLYRIKMYGNSDSKSGSATTNSPIRRSYGFHEYTLAQPQKTRASDSTVQLMEEEIIEFVESIGLESSDENISLAKEFVRSKLDVNLENIQSINDMKSSLESLIANLDYDRASKLLDIVDIENDDIRIIAEKLASLEAEDMSVPLKDNPASSLNPPSEQAPQDISEETIAETASLKDSPETPQLNGETLLADNTSPDKSNSSQEPGQILVDASDSPKAEHIPKTRASRDEEISTILGKVDQLKSLSQEDLVKLLRKNVDFNINKISRVIFGNSDLEASAELELSPSEVSYSQSVSNISSALSDIGELEFKTVALGIKQNSPLSLMGLASLSKKQESLERDSKFISGNGETLSSQSLGDISKSLSNADIKPSPSNLDKAVDIYQSYNNLKEKLTLSMVSRAISNNLKLEGMDIRQASSYIDSYLQGNSNYTGSKLAEVDSLRKDVSTLFKNGDISTMMTMRSGESLSLSQLQRSNSVFENKDQFGHKLSDLVDTLSADETSSKNIRSLRDGILSVQRGLKAGAVELEEQYRELERGIEDLSRDMEGSERIALSAKEKLGEVTEALQDSRKSSAENKILQLPILLNENITNLNMYFKDKKNSDKRTSDNSISAIMSIDTKNLGNLNISLDIKNKKLSLSITAENKDYASVVESYSELLSEKLSGFDYSLEGLKFSSESEESVFEREDPGATLFPSNGKLDIKI